MWRKLSLRARINCLVGIVLTLGLAANVARLVLEAGPRVQAEDRSVIRLTREVIESIGPGLNDDADSEARLDKIVADLNRSRHVSIARSGENATARESPQPDGSTGAPPAWFVALIHPERISVAVPVLVGGRQQSLSITSQPDDEMQEIWDGIVTQLVLGLIIAVVLFVVTSLVVRRSLAPLDALSQAMIDIEVGGYQARVAPSGAPELAALCERLNHLAATLSGALEDRRRLSERMVSLQDLERKDIARELHDEFGPHLFALRAHAGAVMRLAERDPAGAIALSKHGTAILEQINVLQQYNRRILERLRPAGLVDLGLPEAIEALLRLWRDTYPAVTIDSRVAPKLERLSEATELTAYRVVQEALTNVFRHAQATRVSVMVAAFEEAGLEEDNRGLIVRVSDNGRGLDPDGHSGFGLIGMRERVWALGGTLTIVSDGDGVTIKAVIPGAKQTAERLSSFVSSSDSQASPAGERLRSTAR